MGNGALYMAQLYLIRIFPGTTNGIVWNDYTPIKPGERNYQIVGKTKKNVHLVPEGGTMWDRISVPKNKMKVIRKVIK